MECLESQRIGNVTIIKLDNGPTNPIGPDLVRELSHEIQRLAEDENSRSIVLSSTSSKFFSIGLSLPELVPMSRDEISQFFHSFNQLCIDLYSLQKPTISAIDGHAIAGGCILSLCTDYRFGASIDGSGKMKLMGLNEIKLGIPVPFPADRILTSIVGSSTARNMMETGNFYSLESSSSMGLVDELHPQDILLEKAIEKAKEIGASPQPGYRMIKQNRIDPVIESINRHRTDKQQYLIDCWFLPETRVRLKEALEKF
jgi:enoyl-CoA hydratase/carnithine racemase